MAGTGWNLLFFALGEVGPESGSVSTCGVRCLARRSPDQPVLALPLVSPCGIRPRRCAMSGRLALRAEAGSATSIAANVAVLAFPSRKKVCLQRWPFPPPLHEAGAREEPWPTVWRGWATLGRGHAGRRGGMVGRGLKVRHTGQRGRNWRRVCRFCQWGWGRDQPTAKGAGDEDRAMRMLRAPGSGWRRA
jgi:hypothetical protein